MRGVLRQEKGRTRVRCACDARVTRVRCACDARAMRVRCACDACAVRVRCARDVRAAGDSGEPRDVSTPHGSAFLTHITQLNNNNQLILYNIYSQ